MQSQFMFQKYKMYFFLFSKFKKGDRKFGVKSRSKNMDNRYNIIDLWIIKIKSMEGSGIDNCNFIREWIGNNGMRGEGTAEGFADDLTLLFKYRLESMAQIMGIMEQFRLCSGLELNKSKTQLMVVGMDRILVGEKILEIEVVGSVKVLGLKIDRRLEELGQNWEEVIRKLEKLCNFWKLQKLSIVGRILIAKTYLMSNVNFLMGSIAMSKVNGDKVNEIMANYAYPNPNTAHTQMSTFVCPKYTKAHFCMSQPQYHTYTMANYAYPNPNTTHTQMCTFVCPKYTKW